jgi:hypothetical protein
VPDWNAPAHQSLGRVLHAYAAMDPRVGYTQGMNYIAGQLLIVFGIDNEEEVFWIMVSRIDLSYFIFSCDDSCF